MAAINNIKPSNLNAGLLCICSLQKKNFRINNKTIGKAEKGTSHFCTLQIQENWLKIESGSPGGPGIGVRGARLNGSGEGRYFDCKIVSLTKLTI